MSQDEPTMSDIWEMLADTTTEAMDISAAVVKIQRGQAIECQRMAAAYRDLASRLEEMAKLHAMIAHRTSELTGDVLLAEFEVSGKDLLDFEGIAPEELESDDD